MATIFYIIIIDLRTSLERKHTVGLLDHQPNFGGP
jgi:hypothetical protein